jgi:hypothetical protein
MERTGGGVGERTDEGSGVTDAPASRTSSAAEKLAALEAAARVLAETRSVLVIDWPSRDVPVSLAFAGFTVFVKGGPGPADYAGLGTRRRRAGVTAAGSAVRQVDVAWLRHGILG